MANTGSEETKIIENLVTLQSNDGKEFKIPKNIASRNGIVKHILEDLDADDTSIPLPNVSSAALKRVIDFDTHVIANPASINTSRSDKSMPTEWEREFFCDKNMSVPEILELVEAANFLDNADLLNSTSRAIAHLYIRGHTPEEIRALLGIENDHTEESIAEIVRENTYIESFQDVD